MHPIRIQVEGDHGAAVVHRLGQRGRLAAGRGADLENAIARSRAHQCRDRLTRLVLRRGPPLPHGGEPGRVADALDEQRIGDEHPALHPASGLNELRGERVGGDAGAGSARRVRPPG